MKYSQLVALSIILTSGSAFAATSPSAPASPLEGVKAKYVAAAKGNEASIRTFRANGGSCGFIGGIIVGKMSESEQMQAQSRQQIDKALSSVIAGDSSKKAAVKAKIDAEIASLRDGMKQTQDNLGTIENALSTDSPTCKLAHKSFFAIQTGSKEMIAQLSSARQLLDAKQANLLTDGAAAYATYDTAAARVEQDREQSESREESVTAELR